MITNSSSIPIDNLHAFSFSSIIDVIEVNRLYLYLFVLESLIEMKIERKAIPF